MDWWDSETWNRLLLWCVEDVGVRRLETLIGQFGSATNALAAGGAEAGRRLSSEILSRRWSERWPTVEARGALEDALARCGASVLAHDDEGYPGQLKGIDGPAFLFVRGDPVALSRPMAAVVGTRSVRPDGARLTREVTGWCVDQGWDVISGGALGVDTVAHDVALSRGRLTVVVQPAGLAHVAPASNRRLFTSVCEAGGCLVSEHPPWRQPRRRLFARRNRLISGLSRFVVVVRAPKRSGALITVAWAREQGRPIYVVPGSPADPTARGCLDALANGAQLLAAPSDLPRAPGTRAQDQEVTASQGAVSGLGRAILEALAGGELSLDGLVFRVDENPTNVLIEASKLLLAGSIEMVGPGQYRARTRTY